MSDLVNLTDGQSGSLVRAEINKSFDKVNTLVDKSQPISSGTYLKTIAFGDSITDNGDASSRIAMTDNYALYLRGWWVWADQLSKSPTYMLDGKGVNGDNTSDLLARMDDVLLSGADVVLLGIGTNDLGGSLTAARDNVISIVDQILAANMSVIIRQIPHRDPTSNLNDEADTLNNYYKEIALSRERCSISEDLTEFNALVVSDMEKVLYDDLHPNNYGSMLIGQATANSIDSCLSSGHPNVTLIDINSAFNGGDGNVTSGATGEVPDGWILFNADPTDGGVSPEQGVGSTISYNKGQREVTIKTGSLQTPIESRNVTLKRTTNVTVTPNDILSFQVNLSFDDISTADVVRIFMVLENGKEVSTSFSNTLQNYQQFPLNNKIIRTAKIDVGASTYVKCYIQVRSIVGERTTIKIHTPKIIKFN